MNNKEQRLDNLTWKYFWEQKVCEVFKFIGIALGIVFIPYFAGLFFNLTVNEIESFMSFWFGGFILLISFALFLFMIHMIYLVIRDWFKSNWKKARERAREDLK